MHVYTIPQFEKAIFIGIIIIRIKFYNEIHYSIALSPKIYIREW